MKRETPKVDVLEELRAIYELRIKELEKRQIELKDQEFNFLGQDIQSRILEANTSLLQVQILIIKNIGK